MHNTVASDENKLLGFWIYLMTDCILFMTLFVAHAVLWQARFGHYLELPGVFAETMVLLTSSLTSGVSFIAFKKNQPMRALFWLVVTLLLGSAFLALEIREFAHLIEVKASWQRHAALSSFFALVGTHGLHITAGLIWGCVLCVQISILGIQGDTLRRFTMFNMFWHFLDLIWVFIFTYVYLLGGA